MSRRFAFCIAVSGLALCMGAASCAPVRVGSLRPQPNTWFVAADGDDAWSGGLPAPNRDRTDGPFASLRRARDELRRRKAAGGLPHGATVLVREGTYFLAEPLIFSPQDSGTEQGPITYAAAPGEDGWTAWQKLGYDRHSVIADPLFVDPRRDDYRLRDDSPAFKLGFQAIPFEKIGPYKSPDRATWPVADDCWREEHVLRPEGEPQPATPGRPSPR